MRIAAALVVFAIALFMAGPADAAAIEFAPGQLWSVKGSSAQVIVVKVEPWRDRTVIHISIINMPYPPDLPWLDHIGHMPFDKEALAASVDKLIDSNNVVPTNGFDEGYANWKANQGGIFTISVPEAMNILFETVHKNMPAQGGGE